MAQTKIEFDPVGDFASHPSDYMFYLLSQLTQRRQNIIGARLEAIGLDISKWRPILYIGLFGPCAMKDLARLSGVDRTTLTRAVDRLVADDLVRRSGSPADRRQVILNLTSTGEDMFRRGMEIKAALNRGLLATLAEASQRKLCQDLEAVLEVMVEDRGLTRALTQFNLAALQGGEA